MFVWLFFAMFGLFVCVLVCLFACLFVCLRVRLFASRLFVWLVGFFVNCLTNWLND